MTGVPRSLLPLVLGAASLAGCASTEKPWESPFGPLGGQQFAPMEVIGIASRATATLNRPNAQGTFIEDVTIDVPVGTEFILPAIRGWELAYGELDPDTVDAHVGLSPATWKASDRPFGGGGANILVKDINAPDTSVTPPKQSAVIAVSLHISDYNRDDRWFGVVNYSLLFLKRRAA